jgi:hypothetical protein
MRRKLVLLIVIILISGAAVLLYSNNQKLKTHREEVFKRVTTCQQDAPIFGDFSQTAEKNGKVAVKNRSEIVARIGELSVGLTPLQVHRILGSPSFNDARISKDADEYGGCDWDYLIQAKIENGTLVLVDHLQLTFDESQRLRDWSRTDQFGTLIDENSSKPAK